MNNFIVVNVAQWYSRWLEEWRLKVQLGGNFDRIIIVLLQIQWSWVRSQPNQDTFFGPAGIRTQDPRNFDLQLIITFGIKQFQTVKGQVLICRVLTFL